LIFRGNHLYMIGYSIIYKCKTDPHESYPKYLPCQPRWCRFMEFIKPVSWPLLPKHLYLLYS
jgi:hypothetical protein